MSSHQTRLRPWIVLLDVSSTRCARDSSSKAWVGKFKFFPVGVLPPEVHQAPEVHQGPVFRQFKPLLSSDMPSSMDLNDLKLETPTPPT